MTWLGHSSLFLLGVSSLFPLINPIGTALILNPYFSASSLKQRKSYALQICVACFFLGFATLFLGSWVLKFMGISIAATQMGGGILIARMGLQFLGSESDEEETKETAKPRDSIERSLFYPLAFPLTLGPGGLSVLITLSAHAHAQDLVGTFERMAVLGVSLLVTMVMTYFCFAYTNVVIHRIGATGSMVLNRLMAFVVFCIGIQMILSGLTTSFPHLFH